MNRDRFAASQLRSLRIDAGLSPEQLGHTAGVSGHTIRRIERDACIPTPRVQYLLAQYFGLVPSAMWTHGRKRVAA